MVKPFEKQYWWVIVTYILMQLSSIAGLPLLLKTGLYDNKGFTREEKFQLITGHWASLASLLHYVSYFGYLEQIFATDI